MTKIRFRLIEDTSPWVIELLQALEYKKLDKQINRPESRKRYVIIDVKRREFWIVDIEALNETKEYAKKEYNQTVTPLIIE